MSSGFAAARRLRSLLCLVHLVGLVAFSQTGSLYEQAVSAIQHGSPANAISLLDKLLESNPSDVKARNLRGIALMTSERRAEAEAEFKRAVALAPDFLPVLKNLSLNELALSKESEAEVHLKRLLQLAPKDPFAHLYLAEIAFSQKQFSRAATLYSESEGLQFRDPLMTLHFGKTLLKLHDRPKAELVLEQLPTNTPPSIHFEAGLALTEAEGYAAAAKQFEAAQAGYPDPYKVGFNLVLTSEKARDFEKAVKAGEELLAKGYEKSELYNLLAAAYEQQGQTQKAYDALGKATQIDPGDESNYLDLIALALQHQNVELSLEIAGIGLQKVPNSSRIQLEKGAVLALAGRPTEAEAAFLQATQMASGENVPYIALAMVRIQSGKLAEAIHLLRSRRNLLPNDYLVNLYLGEALSRKGVEPNTFEDNETEQALSRAERANPQSASPHALHGKLLFARGDLTGAATHFEQALKLNPRDSSPAYQLGLIYRKQGDNARADAMLDLFSKNKGTKQEESLTSNLLDLVRSPTR